MFRRPYGFLSSKDDGELLRYTNAVYGREITRGELAEKDVGLYNLLRKRNLIEKIRTIYRPVGFLSDMADEELVKYAKILHGREVTRGELRKKDPNLYDELQKRRLTNCIKRKERIGSWQTYEAWYNYGVGRGYNNRNPVSLLRSEDKDERSWYNKGVHMNKEERWTERFSFKRFRRQNGFFKKMNDKQLLRYTWRLHGEDVTRGELKVDSSLYIELRKRKLIDKINVKINELGYWENWENVKRELEDTIEENNGEFPKQSELLKMKRSSLSYAINKYHSGRYTVMEKIGYNEKKIKELASELEEILKGIK